MNGDLILPHDSYPVDGNTNKAISYETQREIFLSRRESFPMQADINMNNNFIQNIATPTSSHQVTNKGYCDYNFLNRHKGGRIMGSLSMNQNDLFEIPAPKYESSAANKQYVDGEIGKIASVDTTQFIKKDGSVPMAADLDMNGNKIKNVGTPFTYENDAAVNVSFFNTELNASNSHVYTQITNNYKQYIDEKLLKSHLLSSKVENAFKYLSEVDESATISNIYIHGVVDYNGSPHKNKKAYDIDMVYSLGVQNYTSKLGINLFPLANVGKYTLIMEYYFSSDNTNIVIIAESTKTTLIKKSTTFDGPNYKKYLVQFDFPSKANPPHFLYFTISGSGTTSTNPEGYLVFYGVKGWDDTVPPELYDHALETGMFEYDNGNMKMYHDIDMNNNRIKNIAPATGPTGPTDLLMKKSIQIFDITIVGMIDRNGIFKSNGRKLQFYNVFLKNVQFTITTAHLPQPTQDVLSILAVRSGYASDINKFNFSHQGLTHIKININMKSELVSILRLQHANSIPFEVTITPIDFI